VLPHGGDVAVFERMRKSTSGEAVKPCRYGRRAPRVKSSIDVSMPNSSRASLMGFDPKLSRYALKTTTWRYVSQPGSIGLGHSCPTMQLVTRIGVVGRR